MLAQNPNPSLTNAARILRAAVQEGQYATKYSNVFDLKTGDIYFYLFPDQPEGVKLSLAEELKKGRHYYDIPKLKEQIGQDECNHFEASCLCGGITLTIRA